MIEDIHDTKDIDITILALFKYWNWIWSTIGLLFLVRQDLLLSILLPVGISFYTFQALGYLIDVYRGEVKAEKDFYKISIVCFFFPQLVAGPIEQNKNLLHQISELECIPFWDHKRITTGIALMIWGLFQKMVIADRIAIQIVFFLVTV